MTDCVRRLCRWAVETKNIKRIQIRCATGNVASNGISVRLGFPPLKERNGRRVIGSENMRTYMYTVFLKEELMEQQAKLNEHNKQEYPPMHTTDTSLIRQ